MRICLAIILFFCGIFAYSAENTDARYVLNSKADSLFYYIQKKDEIRIYTIASEILNMLDEPEYKNKDSWIRTEIYSALADYKHSVNEIDNLYSCFCTFLCKDSKTIRIDYDTLKYNYNNIKDDEFKKMQKNYINRYNETAIITSFINLMRAKVLMDFVDIVVHKPFKYFALKLINKCLKNIVSDYLVISDRNEEELKAMRISSPIETLEDLKLRYKKTMESLNDEIWYQQLVVLESNYMWFDHDFIDNMEYLLDKLTDRDKSLLQYDESAFSWRIGFHLSQFMSEKDYSASIEFKQFIGDLYYSSTKSGSLEAWLLYINNQFYIAPEETKANLEFRQTVLSIKDKMKDYDFAYWFGYDILAKFYDSNDSSSILNKLNCYAKALMYRNHSTKEIIYNANKLSVEYARNQIKESLFSGLSASHYITWYRKLRDYAINFTESKKEQSEGIAEAYSVLISAVSNFDNIDYSRYLSEKERTDLVEFICVQSIKMLISPHDYVHHTESLGNYSKAIKNLGKPVLAQHIKKLESLTTDSLSEIEKTLYCVNVLGCMVMSVENKNLLDCNRLLEYSELENLACAVALQLYYVNNYEAGNNDMVQFYWGAYHYICGPHDSNYQIVKLIKEIYPELKSQKQSD